MGLFADRTRQKSISQRAFKDIDASRGRIEAANSGGSQVTLEIGVEETRDMLKLRCRPLESREVDSQ